MNREIHENVWGEIPLRDLIIAILLQNNERKIE